MKRIFRFSAILILLGGIVSCSGDGVSDNPNPSPNPNPTPSLITFYATLNGASEVPTNTSTATGTATLIFNNTTKVFTITVNHNVVSATGGHIHLGAIGVNGPIVFPLTSLTPPTAYTSPALTAAQEADLKEGRYYINLHSTAFPDGEIRGQLSTNPLPNLITFYATLNGASEVPTNTSTATGAATLIFNNTTKQFTVTVNHNVVSATGGHIHIGAIGVNGPIVFPLTSLTSPIAYTSPALTAAQEADLKEGRYYINLHSTAFPDGEIRGQLSTNPPPNLITLYATLNGASEVPTNISTATGTATLIFNNTTKAFTITVNHNVVSAIGGHIHIGAIGVNGPIVFPLTSLTSPITFTSPVLTTAQETDLKEGRYYVNLHSTAFPNGEIRGQFDNPGCAGCWDY